MLQRSRALRSHSHNVAQSVGISTISKTLYELLECSVIPYIDLESCSHRVKQVVSEWVSTTKKDKIGHDDLKKLLDLRSVSCSTLPTLKTELQKL